MKTIKLAKFDTTVTLSKEKDGVEVIQGVANSLTMTRSGIRVTEDAGQTLVGKTVPLMLAHDWTKPSIGRATMTKVDGEGLHYEATIYEDADKRNLLLQGIEGGTNYVSIGFGTDNIDKEGNINTVDLLELSLTSIPADAKATTELIKQAIKQDAGESDNEYEDDAPTIQDVLDAIGKLTKLVEDADDKEDDPDKGDNTGDDAEVTEALKSEVAELKTKLESVKPLLKAVDNKRLSYSQSMTLKRLQK